MIPVGSDRIGSDWIGWDGIAVASKSFLLAHTARAKCTYIHFP